MFISPCTLRSTQCAALIALAAVAGIARVERTKPCGETVPHNQTARVSQSGVVYSLTSIFLSAPASTPTWLQTFTSFARWFVSGEQPATTSENLPTCRLNSADESASDQLVALQPELPLTLPALLSTTSILPSPGPLLAARCTQPYLLPYTVGPPSRRENFTLCATGTSVPSDVTATGLLHSTDTRVPTSCSIQPRLACVKFSGPNLAGPVLSLSSALRGKPARLPRSSFVLPSLGVPNPRGGLHFFSSPLST